MTSVHNPGPNSYVLLQVGKRRFALPADTVEELAPPDSSLVRRAHDLLLF